MKFMLAFSLLFFSSSSLAGKNGYITNGKVVVVYNDGKKVGEWPSKVSRAQKKQKLAAASEIGSYSTLYFVEDELARCYSSSEAMEPINCIRK